jgi:malonyl-CoA/methylmalonyl-CoA synthetase
MPRATAIMGGPTYYIRLLQHENLSREKTAHMRLFISGSAPLLEETDLQDTGGPDISFSNATA